MYQIGYKKFKRENVQEGKESPKPQPRGCQPVDNFRGRGEKKTQTKKNE